MSGGAFDYAYSRVNTFACELEQRIPTAALAYEPRVTAELNKILAEAWAFSEKMKAVEWLFSGDTSDDSFMEEIKAIETTEKPG